MFYKYEAPDLHQAPNFVYLPSRIVLTKETHTNFDYPVEGWYWFDEREQALDFFGITEDDLIQEEL
jgi:hypothetical protein